MLRVSRRGLDSTRRHGHPELALTAETKLMPGVAVETEIPLWPTAMRWHAGEQLRLRISSKCLLPPLLPGLSDPDEQPGDRHIVHSGPRLPSRLRSEEHTSELSH